MSIVAFFAGMGGGLFVQILWDQYKLYRKQKRPTGSVKGGFDSEGRYYEE
jgi:hypothetical protein